MRQHCNESVAAQAKTRATTLVWGACGFIGQHLTEALLDSGKRVRVLCRERANRHMPRWTSCVEWVNFSELANIDSVLKEAVDGADVIYDLAGSSGAVASNRSPQASIDANCEVHLRLLKACAESGHRPHVVFPSTRLVYGPTGSSFVTETHLPNPQSVYAVNKLCVEQYLEVASYLEQITYTVCRITNPYGYDFCETNPGYKILNSFLTKALAGESILLFGDGSQLRDFLHISDTVSYLIACGTSANARNQTFNIGAGLSRSLMDAARVIRDLTGARIECEPWPEDYLAVESGDFVCDVTKARKLLNLRAPLDLETGLSETLHAYRARSMEKHELVNQ